MFNLAPVRVPDLSGKVVLVTGAGRGIGIEVTRVLAEKGARVFAGLHRQEPVESLPDGVIDFPLDVTSQWQTDKALLEVQATAGRLDVLINNAGIISPIGSLSDLKSDDLIPAYAVNVAGVHRVSVAALPLLRESRGLIINAGTGAATTPMEGWTAYCTSKAGVLMLSRMFDLELAGDGIKTFFIGIPPTDTPMQEEIRRSGLNPISKILQSDLVAPRVPASVIAWLCSAQARDIDEVVLDVRDDRFKMMMDFG